MASTGVALFVYERPEHTRRVLDGLRENGVDELYVFADGPKPEDDPEPIRQVREIVRQIGWCETHVVEREENWGLADTTIDGIDRVLEDHDRVVVLEDDDVPAPDFLEFVEGCLDRYADESRVMHVSGYRPPFELPPDYPYDVFFTRRDYTWGWATWADAWDRYERKPEELSSRLERDRAGVRRDLEAVGVDLLAMLENSIEGDNDSWSVWWSLAIAEHDGLCVFPVESRIRNIGHDGTGTHCSPTDRYEVNLSEDGADDVEFPRNLSVDERVHDRFLDTKSTGTDSVVKAALGSLVDRVASSRLTPGR